MVFSMGKHYCSSKHYLYFVELSLTLCPLNHHACSTMCVSGHFSSYIAFLCICLSPRVRSEFESSSPSVHSRTSLTPLGQCCGNILSLPSATTYSVTSVVNGSQIWSEKSPLWSPVVINYLRTTVSLSLFRPCLSQTMTVTPLTSVP